MDYTDGSHIEYPYDAAGNPLTPIITRPVTITILVDPPNSGTTTGAGRHRVDTNQALTATPGSAFDFAGWFSEDGTQLSSSPAYIHLVTGAAILTARFTPISPPVIVTHPAGIQLTSGAPLNLSVTATGRDPLGYRWRLNGAPLGDTSPTLSRPVSNFLNAGTYTVEVSNPGGATISQSALVTIPIANYTEWRNRVFTPEEITVNDPSIIGPSAKVGNDELTNLMRYALGGISSATLPSGAFQLQNQGQFVFRRLIGGGSLDYKIGLSADMITWDESGNQVEPVGSPIANSDGLTEKITYRVKPSSAPAFPRAFFRLTVTDTSAPPGTTDSLILSDTFDGLAINAQLWNPSRQTVSQSDGVLKMSADVTDHYGLLESNPIPFDPYRLIKISRRVFVHAGNPYCIPVWQLRLGSLPWVTVQYGNMIYNSLPYRSVIGLTIMRNGYNAHQADTQADQSTIIPVPWDTWFDEEIVYDPSTGKLDYSINGIKKIDFNVGAMPTNSIHTLVLYANAAGWFTGHQHYMDDLRIEQPANGLRMSRVIFEDAFNDNLVAPLIWNPLGNSVTASSGFLSLSADVTDQYGRVDTKDFWFDRTRPVIIERKVFLHASNDYSIPAFLIRLGSLPAFGQYYGRMVYNSFPYRSVTGLVLAKNGQSPHLARTESDAFAAGSVPWDTWFDEQIKYDPDSGDVQYRVDGDLRATMNIGPLPSSSHSFLSFYANAAGWFTGHQHITDDFRVRQEDALSQVAPPNLETTLQPGPLDGKALYFSSFDSLDTGFAGQGGARKDERLNARITVDGREEASALMFDLKALPPIASQATISLFVSPESPSADDILVGVATRGWGWSPVQYWIHFPTSSPLVVAPATPAGSWLTIDVTSIYNQWQAKTLDNWGIVLRTSANSPNHGHVFASPRCADPSIRPKLHVIP